MENMKEMSKRHGDRVKRFKTGLTGVPKGEKGKGEQATFEEIMPEDSPELLKDINPHILDV